MPSYSVATRINASPAAVYAAVSDLPGHGSWSADPVEITPLDESPPGPGKRYRSVATSKGKTFEAELEVTETAPPHGFGFTARDATGSWQHRFTLTADGDGTRVERTMTGELTAAQALLFYVVLPIVKRPNARIALDRLRKRVEAGG